MLQNGKDLKKTQSNKLETGDLVAMHIDDQITRVLVERTAQGLNLFMIDIGEELKFDEECALFEMANYYKHLPAQAILCKVKDFPKKEAVGDFLFKHLHQQVEVEVVKVKYNTVHVKFVSPNLTPVLDDGSVSDLSEDIQSNGTMNTNTTQFSSTNPFLADLMNEMKIVENEDTNSNNENMEEFLNDNETGTSNAMVAVMGYDPKDESRYCKHYNEETGGCFKGVNCTFIHQKPLQDGWARDQAPTFHDIPEKIPVPAIGEELSLEMCYCEDIDSFFGYILNPQFHRSNAISLNTLNREINRQDNLKKLKRFKQILPCKFISTSELNNLND